MSLSDYAWEYCPVCKFDVAPIAGKCSRRRAATVGVDTTYTFMGHRLDNSKRPLNGLIPELLRKDTQFMMWVKQGGIDSEEVPS